MVLYKSFAGIEHIFQIHAQSAVPSELRNPYFAAFDLLFGARLKDQTNVEIALSRRVIFLRYIDAHGMTDRETFRKGQDRRIPARSQHPQPLLMLREILGTGACEPKKQLKNC